jgi:hypothetical protein
LSPNLSDKRNSALNQQTSLRIVDCVECRSREQIMQADEFQDLVNARLPDRHQGTDGVEGASSQKKAPVPHLMCPRRPVAARQNLPQDYEIGCIPLEHSMLTEFSRQAMLVSTRSLQTFCSRRNAAEIPKRARLSGGADRI